MESKREQREKKSLLHPRTTTALVGKHGNGIRPPLETEIACCPPNTDCLVRALSLPAMVVPDCNASSRLVLPFLNSVPPPTPKMGSETYKAAFSVVDVFPYPALHGLELVRCHSVASGEVASRDLGVDFYP